MKNLFWQTILKNGLYAGGILAGYFLLLYLLSRNFIMMNFITFLIQAAAVLFFSFASISQVRKITENRTIKFLPAMMLASSVMFMALLIFALVKFAVIFFIDTEYLKVCVDEVYKQALMAMDKYPEYADKMGNPEEIKNLLNIETHLPILGYYLVKSVVIGALVALIARKKDRLTDSLNA